ncbi:hypothetical protein N752_08460 [Desulforamulus aquiferis]|nr:hypothetical protein N752_08460 [Desulforamulus aquiferis]
MRGPKSFTAEDVVEISCHGGIVPLNRVLKTVLNQGARFAEAGEFSKRAFINGRLDLAQAESIIDLIRSKTEAGAKIAISQLGGKLSKRVSALQSDVLGQLAKIEAIIDFPEDDLPEATLDEMSLCTAELINEINKILESAESGKIYREGLQTIIVGKPNVGKSSLLNALLKEQRAIVTDIPGTTRDVIEEVLNIRGVPLKIMDTAGLRETQDLVEQLGVERTRKFLDQAELILMVVDAITGISEEDKNIIKLIKGKKTIFLINKIDLEARKVTAEEIQEIIDGNPVLEISAKNEIGLDKLEQTILELVLEGKVTAADNILVSNTRHKHALERAAFHLSEVIKGIRDGIPPDLVSIDIKSAWEILGEITGNNVTEDLIDRIFADFCIGK